MTLGSQFARILPPVACHREYANDEDYTNCSVEIVYEKALVAIKNVDLDSFISLQECVGWKNLSEEDLGHLTYSLFENCLEFNDAEQNKIGVKMLKDLIVSHPNANTSAERLIRLLIKASESGNFAVFEMLNEHHPKWLELDSAKLYNIMEENFTSCSNPGRGRGGKDYELRRLEGKVNIVSLLLEHKNWDNNSSDLICKFSCLLASTYYYISPSKIPAFIDQIKDTKGWHDMDANQITEVLKNVNLYEQSEYLYQLFMKHNAWPDINVNMLAKIACNLAYNNVNPGEVGKGHQKVKLLNFLVEHPNWKNLKTSDLAEIYEMLRYGGDYAGEFILQLSKHPRWSSSISKELET